MMDINLMHELVALFGYIFMAGAVYGAIKGDLKLTRQQVVNLEKSSFEKIKRVENSVGEVHSRLDGHINMHLEKGI